MTNKENHPRYIYIRSSRQQVPVSEQEFQDYYRDINAYRRRMQEHKCCNCPPRCRLMCDMDCFTCPYQCGSEFLSLDAPLSSGDDGDPISLGETIPDSAPSVDDIVADELLLADLYDNLQKLDPEMRRILELSLNDKSEREIAVITGASKQSTINYRKKKAISDLQDLMIEK